MRMEHDCGDEKRDVEQRARQFTEKYLGEDEEHGNGMSRKAIFVVGKEEVEELGGEDDKAIADELNHY